MKTSQEFKSGKHGIGFVSDYFLKNFGDSDITEGTKLSYSTLQKRETDSDILAKDGMAECTLGDIIATIDSATEEMKDGNWNLFYPRGSAFVVGVCWVSEDRGWDVCAWGRDSGGWRAGRRIFSPATISEDLKSGPSDTLTLETLALQIKELIKRVGALEK